MKKSLLIPNCRESGIYLVEESRSMAFFYFWEKDQTWTDKVRGKLLAEYDKTNEKVNKKCETFDIYDYNLILTHVTLNCKGYITVELAEEEKNGSL